jgi:hypothetical protein
MTRRTALTAALLAGLLLAGMAVPANAEQSPRASCVMGPHKVEAEGIYTNLSNPQGVRLWQFFWYRLTGGGNKSNVTLRVMEGNSERWEYNSPDNRRPGIWYGVSDVVATSYWGTPNDRIYVRGTFDVSNWPDPSCGTTSQPAV